MTAKTLVGHKKSSGHNGRDVRNWKGKSGGKSSEVKTKSKDAYMIRTIDTKSMCRKQ